MKLKDRFKKLVKKNKGSEGKRENDKLDESARPKNRLYLVVEDVDKVND